MGVGRLAFFGPVQFADGKTGDWCGVVLDKKIGKNNGTVKGVRYFTCEDKLGVFVSQRSKKCTRVEKKKKNSQAWGGEEIAGLPEPKPAPSPTRRINKVKVAVTSNDADSDPMDADEIMPAPSSGPSTDPFDMPLPAKGEFP